MARKAPRRTAERILEASLALFNRFGEPMSPPPPLPPTWASARATCTTTTAPRTDRQRALFAAQYEQALGELLQASGDVADVEDAWFFTHRLFELVWQYRFLYRDLNNLLSRNRQLETQFPALLRAKTRPCTRCWPPWGAVARCACHRTARRRPRPTAWCWWPPTG